MKELIKKLIISSTVFGIVQLLVQSFCAITCAKFFELSNSAQYCMLYKKAQLTAIQYEHG